MNRLSSLLRPDKGTALWVDALGYGARRLLNGAELPWREAQGLAAFYGQLRALLRPDVMTLPLTPLLLASVQDDADLKAAMLQRSRPGFALRSALADSRVRSHAANTAQAVRGAIGDTALVLGLGRLGALDASLASGAGAASHAESCDRDLAAMYLAEFLRAMAPTGIDGLLVEAETVAPGEEAEFGSALTTLANTARHYGWLTGLWERQAPAPESAPIGFLVTGRNVAGSPFHVPVVSWPGGAAPGQLALVSVPEAAAPEEVIDRLAALRASKDAGEG